MKRRISAAALGLGLWAGAGAAQADTLHLPGGMTVPMGGAVEVTDAESSFWGGLLAGQMREAVTEDKLARCIDSLHLYGADGGEKRDRLAQLAAHILAEGRFERLTGRDGGAEAILLSVYVSREEKEEIEALLVDAREPDIPMAGSSRLRRSGISAGKFSLVEASPVKRGVSAGGVGYQWGEAALTFAGQWGLTLPFSAVYAVQSGASGEAYTLFLALPESADYFLPHFEKGLAEAEDGGAAEGGA